MQTPVAARGLAAIEPGRCADALAVVAEGHLGIPRVVHRPLRGSGEKLELIVEDADALRWRYPL